MVPLTRFGQYTKLFPTQPVFRWHQIEEAFFSATGWSGVSTLPKAVKESLQRSVPWLSYRQARLFSGRKGDTYKAALELRDGERVETVLMRNGQSQWTICVSSQIGCAMGCNFCLTGTMGLRRNLTSDEIVDQYRYWMIFLQEQGALADRISNMVMMGMGEPMLNYESVRSALNTLFTHTDMGPTHVTVSSVGVFAGLEKMLNDSEWPPVRLAISLHSADPIIRKKLIPTSPPDFFDRLTDWARKYERRFGNRRHHLTFEYIMIHGINDSLAQAARLGHLINRIGQVRVNLIPYNMAKEPGWQGSSERVMRAFAAYLKQHGIVATRRKSMGDDIKAACGQLVVGDSLD